MKTTVLIPAYNHETTVRASVESSLQADPGDVHVIAIDDGSPDRTYDVLKEVQRDYPDCVSVFTQENQGLCKTLNRALSMVDTEFVAILASDDERIAGSIKQQRERLVELPDDVGLTYGSAVYVHIDEYGDTVREATIYNRPHNGTAPTLLNLLKRNEYVSVQCCLYRTAAARAVGGFDETLAFEDRDFQLRFSRLFEMAFYEEPVVRYLTDARRVSLGERVHEFIDDYMKIIDKHAEADDVLALDNPKEFITRLRGQEFNFLANKYFAAGEFEKARELYVRADRYGYSAHTNIVRKPLTSWPLRTSETLVRSVDWLALRVLRRLAGLRGK